MCANCHYTGQGNPVSGCTCPQEQCGCAKKPFPIYCTLCSHLADKPTGSAEMSSAGDR